MRALYNLLFLVGFVLSAPWYFLKMWRRGNWRGGFGQRFARYSSKLKQALSNRQVLWIHAVSVGEVNICTQLIQALELRAPNLKLVVSTTTTTGMGELVRQLPSHIEKIYYPIDRRRYVWSALMTIHPSAVILVEAEIWPNFLWAAQDIGIPVLLVNARLSERSFRGYRRFGFLFRPLFASLAGIGCQNAEDARRLGLLGGLEDRIRVVGNLKYDAARLEEKRNFNAPQVLAQLGVPKGAPVLLAGSTHAGEEALLAGIYLRLKERIPDLFLILVPRHCERGKEVGAELARAGVRFVYRSEMVSTTRWEERSLDCLLVNTTGELKYLYEIATVVFVGKSLTADGGQNPLEPGALGKAMIFGPHMQNFEAIASALVSGGGAVQVPDAAALEIAAEQLLRDAPRREALGRNAVRIVRENTGGIAKTVDLILEVLRQREAHLVERF